MLGIYSIVFVLCRGYFRVVYGCLVRDRGIVVMAMVMGIELVFGVSEVGGGDGSFKVVL